MQQRGAEPDRGAPLDPPPPSRAVKSPRPAPPEGSSESVAPAASDGLTFRAEGYRKVIHLASAVLPALVWVLPRPAAIALLGVIAATALLIECARRFIPAVRERFLRLTGSLLRSRELSGLSGATWMAIAYLIAVVIFPRPVAVAAMLFNVFGDGLAALVGKRWGRHRVPGGKSLEGAAAGFSANLVVGLTIPGISAPAALIGGAGAALLELLPIPINDNLVVTIGGGALVWIAMGG